MRRRAPIISAAVALTLLSAAGCGTSGGPDKAGGEAAPITLHLATQDRAGFPAAKLIAHFAEQVRRRSGGSIRIAVTYNAAGTGPRWDQKVAELARSGRMDLALVPSRAWDVLGVRSMQALQTPFLLQSSEQVDRVVSDPQIASTMLAGLRPLGLAGLALIPESLRHPFAYHGDLRSLRDFAGATIRAPRSDETWALLRALGARPVDLDGDLFYAAVASRAVKGAESDLDQADGSLIAVTTATSNVTFFPRVDALVAGTRVLSSLSTRNREVLRNAAADTVAWAPHGNPTENAAARAFCRGGGRVVAASTAEVRALVAATQTVIAAMERNAGTRALIARIREVAGPPSAAPAPTCEPPEGSASPRVSARGHPTPIDGTYRNTITVHDYTAAGVDEGSAFQNSGIHTITLHDGRLHDELRSGLTGGKPCDGSYSVHGHQYTFAWGKTAPCTGDFTAHWSLLGTKLRFTSISAPDAIDRTLWGAKPFRKIG
jgi:TRAP-type C4-dicarboxylate transport system substrate-binding protein